MKQPKVNSKTNRKEKSLASNRFSVIVGVSLPRYGQATNAVNRWLNVQHDGRELIPLNEKCSQKHKDAAWQLHMGRMIKLTFEVNKDGLWKLIPTKYDETK